VQLNLLEKTELRIYGLELNSVNLTRLAAVAAEVLNLPPAEVLVVDVRDDHVCLDILTKSVDVDQIIGKERALLAALSGIAGLKVKADAYVDSAGILGLIGCDETQAAEVSARSAAIASEIEQAVLGRATVFATGFEVLQNMIEDTNSPYLVELLNTQGYKAGFGGAISDDSRLIASRMLDAAERGIGLVVTTGGVGAEDKDFSVEALCRVDPEAATPWLVKFQPGTGRHVKEGVRIAVGQYGLTTFVCLPGPHDEVVAAGAALKNHCVAGRRIDKAALAADIAAILREKLRQKHAPWHHRH